MEHITKDGLTCPYCWFLYCKWILPKKIKRILGRETPEEKLLRAIFNED
jgi:hypothetical protein